MYFKQICSLVSKINNIHFTRHIKKEALQKFYIQKNRNLLNSIIENYRIQSLNDWKRIRHSILEHEENRGQFTANNIDALIIGYCVSKKNCDLGTSYLNFLNKENIKPNLATLGKYLKLLYAINEDICLKEGKKLPKIEEELILRCYEDLRRQYPVLDSFSLENAILALSLTSQWRKGLDLIDEIKLTTSPNQASISAMIAAAFLNGEEDLAWQLFENACNTDRFPTNVTFLAFISFLRMLPKANVSEKLNKLFTIFHEYDFKCKETVAKALSDLADRCSFHNKFVTISYRGTCFNCSNDLKKFELSDDEFQDLKSNIFQNVIVGRDVFIKTNPTELDKFKEFIDKMGSYDVVMDGLNVAYSIGTKQSSFVLSSLVASVVSHFVVKNKSVLVLGRAHMTRWPRKNWDYVTQNSTVFLAQNISQDDPYLLYCALHSGKNTVIVTRDLMRGHKFLLKHPKLRLNFDRWLSQRQYQLIRVDDTRGPIFRIPPKFSITAQKNKDTWHIPYLPDEKDDTSNVPPPSREFQKTWLCLKY